MIADRLLARVDGVKQVGVDRWLARCPAHGDRHPSLSIRELDGERVLVHCWAGCAVADVLAATDLTFDALFPEKPQHHAKPERRPFPAADVLRAIEREALIVAVAAGRAANGWALSEVDRQRLLLASSRLTAAVVESRHG